jgi:hypothetical protein
MSEALSSADRSELDNYLVGGYSLNTWHYRLTADPETGLPIGHERTPGNCYGRDGNSAAWWAIAAQTAYAYATGQAWNDVQTMDSLDYFMRLSVNDDASVYELVREFKDILPEELVFLLSWDMVDLRGY